MYGCIRVYTCRPAGAWSLEALRVLDTFHTSGAEEARFGECFYRRRARKPRPYEESGIFCLNQDLQDFQDKTMICECCFEKVIVYIYNGMYSTHLPILKILKS